MAEGVGGERTSGCPPAVFISYASQDAAVTDAVVAALESSGVKCWVAPRDVVPGEFYAGAIVRAIDTTNVIVLVLSENAAGSQHVLREVERASARRHPVVSFRIDSAPMPPDLEYFLNTSHWLDASSTGVDRAMPKLVDAVQRAVTATLGGTPPHPSSAAASAETPSPRPLVSSKLITRPSRTVIALAAVLAFVLAYVVVDQVWLSKNVTAQKSGAVLSSAAPSGTSAAPVISENTVAVLPFVDMSEKKDQEYFADGMAEEILDLLSKIPGLRVIGRTSSFHFKGQNEDLRKVGRELGAAYVLEGSVRKAGDRVRVTAQLVDTSSGVHRWSETYDRAYLDVLKLQDEIATALARELQINLGANDLHPRGPLRNPDAYSSYLRGLHGLDRVDKSGFEEAAAYMQHALQLDPMLAAAAAKLAYIRDLQVEWGFVPAAAGYETARREAENALRVDPGLALPHAVLAQYHLYHRMWSQADEEFRRAVALDPRDPDILMLASYEALALNRVEEAARLASAAVIVDPLSALAHDVLGSARDSQGRLGEAVAEYRRTLEISPTFETVHWELGQAEMAQGHLDLALAEMQAERHAGRRDAGLAIVYHALGRRKESDAALARLEAESADTWAYGVALVHAYRGDADQAFRWLDRAYAQYDQVFFVKLESQWDKLRSDARYAAFLRKMNLPE